MTISVVNPFKSPTAKTFDKSKISQDVCAGKRFPSVDVELFSGRKIFRFGTATTIVDENLSKPKPLEYMNVVQSSSVFNVCADTQVRKQKKILSKIKLAKTNISKLFRQTSHASAVPPCIEPFSDPCIEHSTTNNHPSSLSPLSILQHAEPQARVGTAHEFALRHTSLEAIASPITYGKNMVDERIESLASTFCSLVEASSLSSTGQRSRTAESQFDTFPSTFSLGKLRAIEERGGSTEVAGSGDTQQKEVATYCSHIYGISRSDSDSEVTAYLSNDTLSDHTKAHEVGLVSSETSTSPLDTSLATSIYAEDEHQFLPGTLRGLRRVPNYEDLRNLHTIVNHDSSCSDMSCGSLDCDFSYATAFGINPGPLHRMRKCDNLRKSFLSLEPQMCTPSTCQTNKYRRFQTWLSTRCPESSRNTRKMSTSRIPEEAHKATPASHSRQFLQSIFHPSRRVQVHIFKPSPCQPSSLPLLPPVWSCAKITRSGSYAKRRRTTTKQSMKELKARLDFMDIDPWY